MSGFLTIAILLFDLRARTTRPASCPTRPQREPSRCFAPGLSREVGTRGITVNNIQPGPIDTDLNPAAGDWAAPQKNLPPGV